MTILHAGEIGRLDLLDNLEDPDTFTIFREGTINQLDSTSAFDYFDTANVTEINVNYNALTNDNFIFVDATSGSVTVNLYSAVLNSGRKLTIKKIDSSGNSMILDAAGSETIDG